MALLHAFGPPHPAASAAGAGGRPGRLPTAAELASLGPLLSLSRGDSGALAGWRRAVRCDYAARVDSDGLHECLRFYDVAGECCWRLYALPEDDFLAWERLLAVVPAGQWRDDAGAGAALRWWRGLADFVHGRRWCACLVRIHALGDAAGPEQAALSAPVVSARSADLARRIVHAEGAARMDGDAGPSFPAHA